ncbi:RNA dependent RNA polymerase, partial [Candidatus Bathyarchaeota archaeon]|nr:RNA dependent RNA polymerase [Candidatus Bathyarchaeota archaeon]
MLPPKNGTSKRVSIYLEQPRRLHDGKVQSPVTPRTWYPAVTKLRPSSMSFGVMSDDKTMLVMKKIMSLLNSSEEDEGVGLTVDLIRKKIDISFGLEIEKQMECYKFHLEFSTLKKAYWRHVSGNNFELVIPTDYPPAYFWKRGDLEEMFSANRLSWYSNDMWCRVTDILTDTKGVYETPISLPNEPDDPNFINLGRWTTFGFILEGSEVLKLVLRALEDFNIKVELLDDLCVKAFKGPSFWAFLNKRAPAPHTKASSLLANVSDIHQRDLGFEVRYQLEVCISRGFFSEYQLGVEFLRKLGALDSTTAKQLLEHVADTGKSVKDPMSIFLDNDNVLTSVSVKSKPAVYNNRVTTRKVLVTPTAMYLTSPHPEIANRILRKHRNIQDRFLRVQFTGELLEGGIYSCTNSDRDDEVYKRVYRGLDQGIVIGDRHFEFLAFGNSQMRENGAYFFAPTDHISCDDIRKNMGSLGHIRSIAKFAARMGQCFSTTREVRTVNVPVVRPIPDIENRQGDCFTDGVGKISTFLADMAANEMGLGFEMRPSAFQFRMGGCKGVLAVWNDAQKFEVHIRKSQEKFVSQYNGLEVIRCAQFASATLNRQTVTILFSLGVPSEAFISLLDKHLDAHNKAELNSRDAIALLRQHVDENQTTLTMARILLHGFMEPDVQEPFVLSILNLWKTWSLK